MWSTNVLAGKSYFVDLNANENGNGTYQQPWNNINTVNNYRFSTGDDVYFKCGTTSSGSEKIIVHWSGTPNDKVIIGSYYKNGTVPGYGVSDDDMPVIQGVIGSYPESESGLVQIEGNDHITIQDIKILNSNSAGVYVKGPATDIKTYNVYTQNTKQWGIIYIRGSNGGIKESSIENCTVERASYNHKPGAAIAINSGYVEGAVTNITVKNNTVYHGYEGIGLYKGPTQTIVENNVVYDCRSYHLYVDRGGHNNIFRYNLVYESSDRWSSNGAFLVAMNNEIDVTNSYRDNEYHNNYIAGGRVGFSLGNDDKTSSPSNIKIHNNIIVDCLENFRIWASFDGKDIEINDNISIINSTGIHVVDSSKVAIKWMKNKFNSQVQGSAGNSAIICDILLSKKSGWRSLPAGKVTTSDFTINADNGGSTSNTAGATHNSQQMLVPPKPINLSARPSLVKNF